MATKNFCDICDKPAVKQPEPIELFATALNEAEGEIRRTYNNNKMHIAIAWNVHNSYTNSANLGHICATCLVEALNKHIDKLKETNGQS